jgi:5'-3' exoribonuclease 1
MVLPRASHKHLPAAMQPLMLEETSPIADLFPSDFKTDGEGKRADYEAVVLLPFIDQPRLLAACDSIPAKRFTVGELKGNTVGNLYVYAHAPGSKETAFCTTTLPHYACNVVHPESRCLSRPPPPSLPSGEPGFQPKILQVWLLRRRCSHSSAMPEPPKLIKRMLLH